MEKQLEELKEALEKEKREHALHVNELERRNASEKNRLKKEMLRKVQTVMRFVHSLAYFLLFYGYTHFVC